MVYPFEFLRQHIHRLVLGGSIALSILLGTTACKAGSILTLEINFGYESPERKLVPTDRLNTAILLNPDEETLTLEAKPFVAPFSDGKLTPVPIGETNKQAVVYSTQVRRRESQKVGQPAIVNVTLDLNLKKLQLPNGSYRLAYDLSLLLKGKEVFVRPTAVTQIDIGPADPKNISRKEFTTTLYTPEQSTAEGYVFSSTGGREQIEATYTVLKPAHETTIRDVVAGGIQRSGKVKSLPMAPLSSLEPDEKRLVYFATNRKDGGAQLPTNKRFAEIEHASEITYGDCLVNIPVANHARGTVEESKWFWQSDDPKRYFAIDALAAIKRDVFQASLKDEDVLLYVHGFDTTFYDAILRAAQLKHDLMYEGQIAVFSWPSQYSPVPGNPIAYAHDERENEASVEALGTVLSALTDGKEGKKVHVICHSMGNRVLLKAVVKLVGDNKWNPGDKKLGHVILSAPDVATNEFGNYVQTLLDQSDSVSCYFSPADKALLASRGFHVNVQAGACFCYLKGMETIDSTLNNVRLIDTGHGYFSGADPVIMDERLLLIFGLTADQRRPPLSQQKKMRDLYPYWDFEVQSITPGSYLSWEENNNSPARPVPPQ